MGGPIAGVLGLVMRGAAAHQTCTSVQTALGVKLE